MKDLEIKNPLVSVCMITYNHEPFIRQAIEGVIMQRTNFSIELVIGEDCSQDKTRQICEEYALVFPDIIRLLPSELNLGMMPNLIRTLDSCKGEYISLCEGDDYWIVPNKLQKQVDFMIENKDCSLCFHNAKIINHLNGKIGYFTKSKKKKYNTKDVILRKWFCPTASILVKKQVLNKYSELHGKIVNGDLLLLFLSSLEGDLGYIDEVMSVYNHEVPGSLSVKLNSKRSMKMYINKLNFLSYINQISSNKFIGYILIKKAYVILALLKNIIIRWVSIFFK